MKSVLFQCFPCDGYLKCKVRHSEMFDVVFHSPFYAPNIEFQLFSFASVAPISGRAERQ